MKKFLLMAACLLAAPHVVGTSANAQTVTVTADTLVTIVTTQEGQIGNKSYKGWAGLYTDAIKDKIPATANSFIVSGPICDADVNALFNNNDKKNVVKMDLQNATIDHISEFSSNASYEVTGGTFACIAGNGGYTYTGKLVFFALPKITSKTQTTIPDKIFYNVQGSSYDAVNVYNRFPALTTLIIPEGYTEIGEYFCCNCSTLKSLTLPKGLKTIATGAFWKCTSLPVVEFPESIETIEKEAFYQNDFTTILFPQNVKYLGESSFVASTNHITDVYFQGKTAPEVAEDVFGASAYFGWGGSKTLGSTATREDFVNSDHWMCMLHYRPDLTTEEKMLYEDQTRKYAIPDLYLGNERMWPNQDNYNQAHNYIYYHSTGNGSKGTGSATHFDNTALSAEEMKRIGILRFVLTRDDAPIPEDGPDISDDDWWTICIPYTLTKEEVLATFGEGTQLYGLQKVTRDYNNNKVRLSFTYNVFNDKGDARDIEGWEGTSMKANQLTAWWPYMIKPGDKLKENEEKYLKFSTRVPESGSEYSDIIPATAAGTQNDAMDFDWRYIFRGNCSGKTYTTTDGTTVGKVYHRPAYCYFLGWDSSLREGNGAPAFYYQHNPSTAKVWTHYTCTVIPQKHMNSGTSSDQTGIDDSFSGAATGSSDSKTLSFFGTDDDVTAIEEIEILNPEVATDGDIYNLNGVLVRKNALSTEGLAKGIYVSNGKKFVVK